MKKLFFLTLMLVGVFSHLFAQELYQFNIKNENSVEAYQALIGKTFTYAPTKSKYGYGNSQWEDFGFDLRQVKIVSVEGKFKKNKPFQKMTWTVSDTSGHNLRTITVYGGVYTGSVWSYNHEYMVSDIPFFDMDAFKTAHASEIGTEYTNPRVKASYTVTDVSWGKYRSTTTYREEYDVIYTVKNSISGESANYSAKWAKYDCFKEDLSGKYHSYLSKVEKPSNPAVKYGTTKTVQDKNVTKFSYVDNFIDIIIFGSSTQFNFILKNVSASTQKLVWDDAVFIDRTGSTSKIMHAGTKYSQREASQPASTIIKGASLEDLACPTSNVYYSESLKSWETKSMYPDKVSKEVSQVSLMLPIQIKDVVNEYIFVFDIKYEYDHPERLNLEKL